MDKKRTNLSVKQKLELTEKLESEVHVAGVCEEYGTFGFNGHSPILNTLSPI
jgi:hypothetical protein